MNPYELEQLDKESDELILRSDRINSAKFFGLLVGLCVYTFLVFELVSTLKAVLVGYLTQ